MKKISRIEYCAGFEPLQSGMEQDEGSRILLPTQYHSNVASFLYLPNTPSRTYDNFSHEYLVGVHFQQLLLSI